MPRFAANLSLMFAERDFLDRFAAAADAGFRFVEMQFPYDWPADRIAARAVSAGVEIVLINLPPGDLAAGERGLAALPSRRDAFRRSVECARSYADALGVSKLHVMAGLARPDDPAAQAAYRDALAYACDRLGPHGLYLLIEPINGRDMPGYFLDDFGRAAAIVGEIGRPEIKLQFDVYHRQILHGDVVAGLEALMPIVGHVQIASVPGRNEPGSGELDDGFVLAALDRLGYAGVVGAEYRPAGRTEDGLGWFAPYRGRTGDSR